ncbi:transporter substrate-binding domain-containing protein [Desulfobacula phenolica]|uniref:Polar amino acid transport system substrate-binding protein n=1 Tax=Desulfobacula phenolica TaxID=90732 RepID=A0A1H2IQ28_9BACT|nr:transporter substrate-binding domain-containing protein [Desulfobacula phenolica]SDU45938.1 polar amino acid transport system substrate-binding protein [Desulfobacula phenolica]
MKCLFLTIFILTTAVSAYAQDYKATLAKMPIYAESAEKGVLVDLVKAIESQSGEKINLVIEPFARSLHNVVSGKADFHMPLIAIPGIDMTTLDYDYSTETIFHVNFVLYTKKGSNISIDKLQNSKVETDIAHLPYFNFPIKGSSNLELSLKKVSAGRIDAFIFADFASDPLVKKNNLTNIKRDLFKVYDVKIIIPKNGAGGKTDKFLSETISKLKANGTYDKIMGPIEMPYDNWQL